ncbi:hypothetical protein ACH5RR_033233 [Cinchona calisaya]|uniref:BI1-like protein n=1 Tax=Cinchona calisaya TaxID=153742 RepID=A0ABD2YMF6_9GENT
MDQKSAAVSPKNSTGPFDVDLEAACGYGIVVEDPKLRWAFIRKVYLILGLQLLLTSGIASALFFIHPVKVFMQTSGGLITLISVCMLVLALCGLMMYCRKKHPWNLALMGLFTLANGSMIGLTCAYEKGVTLLEAAALTEIVTVALTLYTFWAARRRQDFSFLTPFLFSSLWVLIAFGVIRIIFPMGKWGDLIAGTAGAIIFSLFIIYDTFNLIKHYGYDDYLEAACALYLDALNFFLAMVQAMDGNVST